MKNIIILFVLILTTLFATQGYSAQAKSSKQKSEASLARQRREKTLYQRMRVQLQQVAYHEAREKRAEKAIREAERVEKND